MDSQRPTMPVHTGLRKEVDTTLDKKRLASLK